MSVFISYSHSDADFVDRLASKLVEENIPVWIDRWELNVGDSLTEKIQSALTESSFLCVVLSEKSINSSWCKRELNSGLMREIEEKRVVVLPLLIDDCEIPLFLKDKFYADFRNDFKKGFKDLLVSLSEVINDSLGRVSGDDYITDWAIDWGMNNNNKNIEVYVDSVSFNKDLDWSILNKIVIKCNENASKRYKKYLDAGLGWFMKNVIIEGCSKLEGRKELRVLIKDNHYISNEITMIDSKKDYEFKIKVYTRRLGGDTGRDILFNYGNIFGNVRDACLSTSRRLTKEEKNSKKYYLW